MIHCVPPAPSEDKDSLKDSLYINNCICDDDTCLGDGCICTNRFSSIPSALFFVILNLSGEFPLADSHNGYGRIICTFTAIFSVGFFAIPTGLVSAALERAISALHTGEDYERESFLSFFLFSSLSLSLSHSL